MNLALNRRELDKKGIFHSNKKKKKQRNNSRLKERTLSRATIHSPISKCFQPASQTHLSANLEQKQNDELAHRKPISSTYEKG